MALVLLLATLFQSFVLQATPSIHHLGNDTSDVEKGLMLISELRCASCHEASADEARHLQISPAPDLKVTASRRTPAFINRWLSDPESRGQTTMPDALHGMNNQERANTALALTAYLDHLATPEPEHELKKPSREEQQKLSKKGGELFNSIGCVACHESAFSSMVEPRLHRIPFLKGTYRQGGLKAFIKDPHSQRPSGRMPRVPMSDEEANALVAYLKATPETALEPVVIPASEIIILDGRTAYRDQHCVRCHGPLEISTRSQPLKPLTKLTDLELKGGCMTREPGKGKGVHYYLSETERRWITAAFEELKKPEEPEPATQLHRKLAYLNCFSCHERNETGGPLEFRKGHFHTTGEDLEDEGRFPPTLTGAGRKLLPEAMQQIIQGKGGVRPYMVTRMPDFGNDHAHSLAGLFATADHDPNEQPTPRKGEENQVGRNMWGRALMGTKGLSCITCHDLNGKRSLGIRAMDLAHAPKRLRPEWFRDYLIDPAKFRSGTRMPSFWPKGKPMLKGNGNSTSRQIDSIWAYLKEIDQSRLPEGMEKKGNFELKPKGRPIVFRTFMKNAGMHAIAMGFEEGVHASFDVETIAWSEAWKGRFLDAESTWDDRFTPLVGPLGEDIVSLTGEDWVRKDHPDGGRAALRFKGFRLNKAGEPILRVDAEGVEIQDHLSPAKNGFTRRLKTDHSTRLWIKVLEGESLREFDGGWSNEANLKVRSDAETFLTNHNKRKQLWLLLNDELEFSWQW